MAAETRALGVPVLAMSASVLMASGACLRAFQEWCLGLDIWPPTIPTTIAGGYVNRPWLPGTHIGGVAITTAEAITEHAQLKKKPRFCAGLF